MLYFNPNTLDLFNFSLPLIPWHLPILLITITIIPHILLKLLTLLLNFTQLEYVLLHPLLFVLLVFHRFLHNLLLSPFNHSSDRLLNDSKPHYEEATAEVTPGLHY